MINRHVKDLITSHRVVDFKDERLKEAHKPELLEFAMAVQRKITGSYLITSGYADKFFVGLHGYPVALGCIYLGRSYDSRGRKKTQYAVESNNIRNVRGNINEKVSVNMNVALRNAGKYLVRRPYHELVNEDFPHYIYGMRSKFLEGFTRSLTESKSKAFGSYTPEYVIDELVRAANQGYEIEDYRIRENIDGYMYAAKEYKNKLDDRPEYMYVMFPILDRSFEICKYTVIKMDVSGSDVNAYYNAKVDTHPQTYGVNELPPELVDCATMIDMVGDGGYAEGYGFKLERLGVYVVEGRGSD